MTKITNIPAWHTICINPLKTEFERKENKRVMPCGLYIPSFAKYLVSKPDGIVENVIVENGFTKKEYTLHSV
jgi:hypothetical protein